MTDAAELPPDGYYIYQFCKAAGLTTEEDIKREVPCVARILNRLRFKFPPKQ